MDTALFFPGAHHVGLLGVAAKSMPMFCLVSYFRASV